MYLSTLVCRRHIQLDLDLDLDPASSVAGIYCMSSVKESLLCPKAAILLPSSE